MRLFYRLRGAKCVFSISPYDFFKIVFPRYVSQIWILEIELLQSIDGQKNREEEDNLWLAI